MAQEWSKFDEKGLARFVISEIPDTFKLPDNVNRLELIHWDKLHLLEIIYNICLEKNIKYALEPFNTEKNTQFIRTYEEIFHIREGTCLDLTVLFCGICLAYDLLPILIVFEGHALAAVSMHYSRQEYLNDTSTKREPERRLFEDKPLYDYLKLQQLINSGNFLPIECTGFASSHTTLPENMPEGIGRNEKGFLSFERAIEAGREQINTFGRKFSFALDVAIAQGHWKIKPPITIIKETISEGLIDWYLSWLIEQYGELELPGLPQGDRRPTVNLDTVYVALRGDLSNPHERMQSQIMLDKEARKIENLLAIENLTPEQQIKTLNRMISLLARTPLPLSIEERDRTQLFHEKYEKTITLGEAFQTERRLVILGDPGSGKTTLSRWLTLKLAQAFLKKEESVKVLLHQVDPLAEQSPEEIDLGPSRVPILMRIATFANERKQNPQRRLAEFIGHHLSNAYGDKIADSQGKVIDTFQLNKLLLSFVESGKAVVILDGLDEIDDPNDRYEIVREIDHFIKANLPNSGTLTLSSNGQTLNLDLIGNPCESGGNQVIVTSRIVGYQMAPLSNNVTHLTIEPMKKRAVERFCEVWIEAIYRASIPPEQWSEQTAQATAKEAEGLKAAITELEEKGAGEIATNPLLITILALVFQYGKASFPKQRVELYKTAVSILIEKWRQRAKLKNQRELADQDILNILVPLAADIHENSSIGIVDEEGLKKVLERHLSSLDVLQFQQVLEEEVGLLTARGQRVYGFLHLTFQEYLAACWLIRDKDLVRERLLEKLNSPRWREPILMALGQLSAKLDEFTLQKLLMGMLTKEDPLSNLIPRVALLLLAALPEMSKIPAKVVEEIGNQLLNVYANHEVIQRFPLLRERIEQAFTQLFEKEYTCQINQVLYKALIEENALQHNKILAVATLIHKNRYYTIELCEALANALIYDSEAWNFPIDRALRDIVACKPDLFPIQPGTLRHTLLQKPDLAQRFLADPAWIRIGIMVYGGLDSRLPERINLINEKIAQLNREEQELFKNPRTSQFEEKSEKLNNDKAVLDKKLKELKENGNKFHINQIYRDSSLTPLILSTLKAESSPYSLICEFWKIWHEHNYLDALLALAALGESITPILQENSTLTQNIISHFSKFIQYLGFAIQAEANLEPFKQLASNCHWEHWIDLISAIEDVYSVFVGNTLNPISLETAASEEAKPILLADSWSHLFNCISDDKFYSLCVSLDTVGNQLSEPPIKLAKVLSIIHQSVNQNWNGYRVMDIVKFTPLATNEIDILTTALDAITAIPENFDFVQGWALMRLSSLLKHNGLIPEAVIITLGSLSNRFNTRVETMQVIGEQDASFLSLLTHPYPAFDLLKIVQKIEDDYLRCRGYLQLLRYFPILRNQLLMKKKTSKLSIWQRLTKYDHIHDKSLLFNEISSSVQNIKDLNQQALMFEQLAFLGNQEQQQQYLELARQAALRIVNPDNSARALTRLAEYFSQDESDKMLDSALKKVEKITNQRQRAETITLLKKSIIKYSKFHSRFQPIISRLSNQWNQWKAGGISAPLLKHYETQLLDTGFNTTSIVLGAIIKDYNQEFELGSDISSLWGALATKRKPVALQKLYNQGKSEGLRLTKEAIIILNQLLEVRELTIVHLLLPLIQSPEPTIIPLVKRWLAHPDETIQRYANLLLAETEGFSKQTLPILIELLTAPEDRTRHRAALALHGDLSLSMRVITTSHLGEDTLMMLAHYAMQFRGKEPYIAQVIGWTFERILYNDGQTIENLSRIVALNGSNAEEAEIILAQIENIDLNTWSIFLNQLQSGTGKVQSALLLSLCKLLFREHISEEMWSDVLPILKTIDYNFVEQQKFLLDCPQTLVESVEVACKEIEENSKTTLDIVTTAEEIFESKYQKLTTIFQEESDYIRQTLTEIGSLRYDGRHYQDKIIIAAERLEKNPFLLEVLIDWLEKQLGKIQQDITAQSYYFNYFNSDLICVVAAGAERLPNTFYNKAIASELLVQRLQDIVKFHHTYTGRQSAIALLSFLRRITPNITTVLKAGLRDVPAVQKIVFQTLDRYRNVEPDFLPQLFKDLLHPSPSIGFATVEMLAAIGNNIYLSPQIRELMMEQLVNAIHDSKSQREVYLLVHEEVSYNYSIFKIKHMGRLDKLFYKIVIQLSGIADIGSRKKQYYKEET